MYNTGFYWYKGFHDQIIIGACYFGKKIIECPLSVAIGFSALCALLILSVLWFKRI
jgi:hypothetical protein